MLKVKTIMAIADYFAMDSDNLKIRTSNDNGTSCIYIFDGEFGYTIRLLWDTSIDYQPIVGTIVNEKTKKKYDLLSVVLEQGLL